MPEPRYEYVRIGLPMPITVVGALGDLINKAWPDATIITDPHKAEGVPPEVRNAWSQGELLVRIDVSKAAKRVSKKFAQATADEHVAASEDTEVGFGGFDTDGTLRLNPPEQLTQALAPIIEAIMDMDGVINYMSWEVVGRPDGPMAGTAAFVSVARSKGQTPDALHRAEKARADGLRAQMDEARALLDRYEAENVTAGWLPPLRAVLAP